MEQEPIRVSGTVLARGTAEAEELAKGDLSTPNLPSEENRDHVLALIQDDNEKERKDGSSTTDQTSSGPDSRDSL